MVKPAADLNVKFRLPAVERIISETRGYLYFLEEWGKRAWEVATKSPINENDVKLASAQAIAALDEGSSVSGSIALRPLMAPLRSGLIAKGMIWSPSHGDTAFTVPLFDQFMKRIMPGKTW